MALMLGEGTHEVAVVELVDRIAVDASVLEGRQRGRRKQLPASTVTMGTERSQPDTSDSDSGHTGGSH